MNHFPINLVNALFTTAFGLPVSTTRTTAYREGLVHSLLPATLPSLQLRQQGPLQEVKQFRDPFPGLGTGLEVELFGWDGPQEGVWGFLQGPAHLLAVNFFC